MSLEQLITPDSLLCLSTFLSQRKLPDPLGWQRMYLDISYFRQCAAGCDHQDGKGSNLRYHISDTGLLMGTMRISFLLSALLLAETESSIQEVSLSKMLSRPHFLSKTQLSNTVYDRYIINLYDLYDRYIINLYDFVVMPCLEIFFFKKNICHVFIMHPARPKAGHRRRR